MPKGVPTRRSTRYRAGPYEDWTARYHRQQPQQEPRTSFQPSYALEQENQDPSLLQPVGIKANLGLDENTQPAEITSEQVDTPTIIAENEPPHFNGASQPPRGPRWGPWKRSYDSYRPHPRQELTMVDSMVLQSIGRTGSRAPPGLAIHSNSRGGGTQKDVFTKVPNASKTVAFRVESEETLLKAYRQVKAMNPSASVGGIMFSVASKTESPFTEVDNIRWASLTGRRSFSSQFTTGSIRAFRNGRSWTVRM
ncbi:hypothetical protein ACLX1H_010189 [Fusarium chlamydosporum]